MSFDNNDAVGGHLVAELRRSSWLLTSDKVFELGEGVGSSSRETFFPQLTLPLCLDFVSPSLSLDFAVVASLTARVFREVRQLVVIGRSRRRHRIDVIIGCAPRIDRTARHHRVGYQKRIRS